MFVFYVSFFSDVSFWLKVQKYSWIPFELPLLDDSNGFPEY